MFFGKFLSSSLLSLLVFNSLNVLPSALAAEQKGKSSVSDSKKDFMLWRGNKLGDSFVRRWKSMIQEQLYHNNIGIKLDTNMFDDIIESIYNTKIKKLSDSESVAHILCEYTNLGWRLSYMDDRYSIPYSVYECDCKCPVLDKPGKLVFTIMYSESALLFFNLRFQPDEGDAVLMIPFSAIENPHRFDTWHPCLNAYEDGALFKIFAEKNVKFDMKILKDIFRSIYYKRAYYATLATNNMCDFDPVINVLNQSTGQLWNVDFIIRDGLNNYSCRYSCKPNSSVKCIFKISYSDSSIRDFNLTMQTLESDLDDSSDSDDN